MPSLEYHVKRSISSPKTSRKLSSLLDMPPWVQNFSPEVHSMWRKKTHNISSAFAIGMIVGGEVGAPKKAIIDALTHINDDLALSVFKNAMRASRKSEEESDEVNGVKD